MLLLRKPKSEDEGEIKESYRVSESIHRPWVYPLKNYADYLSQDGRYFLCLESSGTIVGTFHISGIVRGYFQSAYLSYEVFAPHQRKGYMSVGLRLLIAEAFSILKLHRLEANIQPGNIGSTKLVSRAGFVKEGFSKSYLNVGGHGWKDHERWAIVNNEWEGES